MDNAPTRFEIIEQAFEQAIEKFALDVKAIQDEHKCQLTGISFDSWRKIFKVKFEYK